MNCLKFCGWLVLLMTKNCNGWLVTHQLRTASKNISSCLRMKVHKSSAVRYYVHSIWLYALETESVALQTVWDMLTPDSPYYPFRSKQVCPLIELCILHAYNIPLDPVNAHNLSVQFATPSIFSRPKASNPQMGRAHGSFKCTLVLRDSAAERRYTDQVQWLSDQGCCSLWHCLLHRLDWGCDSPCESTSFLMFLHHWLIKRRTSLFHPSGLQWWTTQRRAEVTCHRFTMAWRCWTCLMGWRLWPFVKMVKYFLRTSCCRQNCKCSLYLSVFTADA